MFLRFLMRVKIFLYIKKKKNIGQEREKPFPACLKRVSALPSLPMKSSVGMDYPKKTTRNTPRCLECGDKISYGRTDKKFCCEECKNRHHNHKSRAERIIRRRTMSVLEKNYEILEGFAKAGTDTVMLSDALILGFNPVYVTSFSRVNHRDVYGCFDITYTMTASKLCSISKIQNLSLNLQAVSVGKERA